MQNIRIKFPVVMLINHLVNIMRFVLKEKSFGKCYLYHVSLFFQQIYLYLTISSCSKKFHKNLEIRKMVLK